MMILQRVTHWAALSLTVTFYRQPFSWNTKGKQRQILRILEIDAFLCITGYRSLFGKIGYKNEK